MAKWRRGCGWGAHFYEVTTQSRNPAPSTRLRLRNQGGGIGHPEQPPLIKTLGFARSTAYALDKKKLPGLTADSRSKTHFEIRDPVCLTKNKHGELCM